MRQLRVSPRGATGKARASCGYTEFYAKDPGNGVRRAAERPRDVRVVDSTNTLQRRFR